jgi:AcrR family transcriptional regulator
MPIEVDRDQRQWEVVEAAIELILAGGLEAVSFRTLARKLGCSTTAISHYFSNKEAVMRAIYHHAASRAAQRRDQAHTSGRANLLTALEEILPLGPLQRDDWVVWMCFWTSALFNPTLAAEHRKRTRQTREGIEARLLAVGHSAENAGPLSQSVLTTLYGIAVQALFDPERWTAEVQQATLRRALQGLGTV